MMCSSLIPGPLLGAAPGFFRTGRRKGGGVKEEEALEDILERLEHGKSLVPEYRRVLKLEAVVGILKREYPDHAYELTGRYLGRV